MESLRLCVSLVVLVSIGVLVAMVDGTDSKDLPPVLRAFQQNQPKVAAAPVRHARVKRQNGVIIDSIFQIPIQTLGAVNNLFKNSVLAFQSWRQGTGPGNQSSNLQSSATSALQYTGSNNNYAASTYNGGNGYYSNNYYRPPRKYNYQSAAAIRGDLPVKGDGSSYRI